MGKAKEKAAREEAKKAEARDDFTRLLRHAKSLKLESTWEDIKPELETHSAYKDVSLFVVAVMLCWVVSCVSCHLVSCHVMSTDSCIARPQSIAPKSC